MRKAILKENSDFQRLYRSGKRAVSGLYAVYYASGACENTRVGIYAGKKALGHAVVRNRMKRRVRETLRFCADEIQDGIDLVIVVRRKALDKNSQEMRDDLIRLLRSCGLFCLQKNKTSGD